MFAFLARHDTERGAKFRRKTWRKTYRIWLKYAQHRYHGRPYGNIDLANEQTGPVLICVRHFWKGFSPYHGALKILLDRAFGEWRITDSEARADLILTSVFPHIGTAFPKKTIAIIGENIRPNYQLYEYSISTDVDDYDGHNFRLPLWYGQLRWTDPGTESTTGASFGNEEILDIDALMQPRTGALAARSHFCGIIASYAETFRMMAVSALSDIAPVDIYGKVSGKIDKRSKYEILRDYRFNLCFENSLFPGYHSEKLIQAWAAGTIPLYFGSATIAQDFNPAAFVNRLDFPNMRDFVTYVRELTQDQARLEAMWRQPLLMQRPSLDGVVAFLKQALDNIRIGYRAQKT